REGPGRGAEHVSWELIEYENSGQCTPRVRPGRFGRQGCNPLVQAREPAADQLVRDVALPEPVLARQLLEPELQDLIDPGLLASGAGLYVIRVAGHPGSPPFVTFRRDAERNQPSAASSLSFEAGVSETDTPQPQALDWLGLLKTNCEVSLSTL